MTNAAVTLPEADIEALKQFYTFKGPELQFLNQNPSLVSGTAGSTGENSPLLSQLPTISRSLQRYRAP